MNNTYPAEEVDSIISQLLGVTQASIELAKEAEQKSATYKPEAPKVILEKVAFDTTNIDDTADLLVSRGILKEENRIKLATEFKEDPNEALAYIRKLASFLTNSPTEPSGSGVKAASVYQPAGDVPRWTDD